jgi:hypothetical protein
LFNEKNAENFTVFSNPESFRGTLHYNLQGPLEKIKNGRSKNEGGAKSGSRLRAKILEDFA